MVELVVTLRSHGYGSALIVCQVTIPGLVGSHEGLVSAPVISHPLLRSLLLQHTFSPFKCSVNLDFVHNFQVHS